MRRINENGKPGIAKWSSIKRISAVGALVMGLLAATVMIRETSAVTAKDAQSIDGASSPAQSGSPTTADGTTAPPATPDGFAADKVTQATVINLKWNVVSGAVGYHLYRDRSLLAALPGDVGQYSDITVQPNQTYSYSLDAFNETGGSSVVKITVESLDTIPPTPPILKGKGAAANQIHLIWTQSTDNRGVVGYRVYNSRNGTGFVRINLQKNTSYIHTGLGPGIHYQYKITAFDEAGNESNDSNIISIDTENNPFNVVYKELPLAVSLQE